MTTLRSVLRDVYKPLRETIHAMRYAGFGIYVCEAVDCGFLTDDVEKMTRHVAENQWTA